MEGFDLSFFRRAPEEVAEELMTSSVTRYRKKKITLGVLTKLDVLVQPEGRDEEIYRAVPGTIVRYASRDGFRIAVAAHETGKSGIVSLLALKSGDEVLSAPEIYAALGGDIIHGKCVGRESGLYLAESGISLEAEGLAISRDIPSDSPPNRKAYFSLRKV